MKKKYAYWTAALLIGLAVVLALKERDQRNSQPPTVSDFNSQERIGQHGGTSSTTRVRPSGEQIKRPDKKIRESARIATKLASICSEFGIGENRNAQVLRLFVDSDVPLDLLFELASGIEDAKEKATAIRGITLGIVREGNLERIKSLIESGNHPGGMELSCLLNGLTLLHDPTMIRMLGYHDFDKSALGGRSQTSLGEVVDLFEELLSFDPNFRDRVGVERLQSLLQKNTRAKPFEVWEQLATNNSVTEDFRNQMSLGVVRQMFAKEPNLALETLDFSSLSEDQASLINQIQEGLKVWLHTDSREALNWIDTEYDHLPTSQQSALASAATQYSVSKGNLDDARRWISQIPDEQGRNDAKAIIGEAEKQNFLGASEDNPSAAIQALSADSNERVDWIENVFDRWIDQEPDGAWKWYQDEGVKLPNASRDYIAASFIKRSLESGSRDEAILWLKQISNEAVRRREAQRIRGEGQ